MRRRWADHGNRLSREDHLEIQRRVAQGETFAAAVVAGEVIPPSAVAASLFLGVLLDL